MKNVEDVYPLSPTQQGILFHSLYAPGTGAYVEQVSWRLDGRLNSAALESAWQQVVARHPALRTCFFWEGLAEPLQVVRGGVSLACTRHDWRALSQSEQQRRLSAHLAEGRHAFDLTRAPLMRLTEFRVGADSHYCAWTYHHLLLDAWSVSLVLAEVLLRYDAYCRGEDFRRAQARPYRDYIAWLRQQDAASAADYWRETLRGFTAPTPLPVSRAREGIGAGEGGYDQQQVSVLMEAGGLRDFASRHHLTLNTLAQGAWALALSRYSGEPDVVFGNVASGRPTTLKGFAEMVGLFVNTLPLRVRVATGVRLLDYLRSVQAQQAAMQRHEWASLKQVRGWAGISGGQPLFESLVVFDNAPVEESLSRDHGGLRVGEFARADTLTGYPLTLEVAPQRELTLRLIYDSRRFERDAMLRVLGHFQNLLTSFTRGAEQLLDDLPRLTESERRELLVEWGGPRAHHPASECLHVLFEAQAARTPERVAVTFEQTALTYRELNALANRLARRLRRAGVVPETRVGLCVENSMEAVVGVLAILKAGGAYVPLDPEYPRERLAFVLRDARVSVLLTRQHSREDFKGYTGRVVPIDDDGAAASGGYENLVNAATPGSLAYIIYTSGSTGQPKGVQVSHHNVTRLFASARCCFEFDESDVWTLFHSLAFDFSVWELWGALLHGGRLVVVPYGQGRSPESFRRLLSDEKVSVLNQTPSAFRQLMSTADVSTENSSLRLVIFGGEALNPQALGPWFARHGDARPRMVNMYGITETTVHVTCRPLTERDARSARSVIGRPLSDLECYVLDGSMRPVPVGATGELYVGGAGLARGYVNLPDLTAERFVPNPFGDEAGSRLYRTGDLARYLADGELEYLGRADDQVKINGFRIEPGEIEATLCAYPDVRGAAVGFREERGEKRLVAYVVPREGPAPAAKDLRLFLRQSLPEYMVPSQFVALASLPLTPSGKVDRRALPPPDLSRAEMEESFTPPRTPTEKTLAEIWSQALGVERVGIHDNFFALGGDSILSMQVVARAKQAGLRLSPRDLFRHQTIAELALLDGAAPPTQAEQELIIGTLPLTPIQRWFFEQRGVAPQHYNQSLLLEARQPLKAHLLRCVVAHLLSHHDTLRLRFAPTATWPRQYSVGAEEATVFSCVDLSALPERDHARAVEEVAARLQASLDLAAGPLLRVTLFERRPDRPSLLLIIIHHLAVDGVSWRILLEDLQTAYAQLSRREQVCLQPKTTSFKHWSEKLAEHAQTEAARQEAGYWLAEERRSVLPLPADMQGGDNSVASAQSVGVALSAEETRALLQDVPRAYRTQIGDVLLTALASVFAQWTGREAVLFDVEGHGREVLADDLDLSRTVGWFTSLYPVLFNVKRGVTPAERLMSVKEQFRAVPNRGLGYGLLRYASADDETAAALRALPQAEVLFNYLGQFDQVLPHSALFRLARMAAGPPRSPLARRSHLLEIDGGVEDGRLQFVWTYSRNVHHRSSIEALAQNFVAELRSLIADCRSAEAAAYTPSDFPLARLTQPALDGILTGGQRVEDIYPLSPMQEGMLLHALNSPESDVYFEQLSLGLQGSIDVASFERAWQAVIDRHAVLRTAFAWQGLDEPLQTIRGGVRLSLALHDWRGLSSREQEERTEELLRAERERGFDLSVAPLMRLALVRLSERRHLFLWCHHHILLDGWSVALLLKEVFLTYEALRQVRPVPSLKTRPYRDYIEWQKRQDMSRAASYWREMLKGFNSPTLLGGDRVQSPSTGRESDSDNQRILLSAELTAALARFARAHHLTLNTVVQGAWALVLSRYSGEPDVVFGVTVAGRPAELAGSETMLGLFINTLPLRVRVSGRDVLSPWLKGIQQRQAELTQYAHSPLGQVQGWSDAPKGRPLFQSILVFENYPAGAWLSKEAAGLEICHVYKPELTEYPLMLVATPGAELSLKLLYDRRRFSPAMIGCTLEHLRTLLTGMMAGGEQRLKDLPLLSPSEQHELLFALNDTRVDYPTETCLPQMFEAQAGRTPGALAVACRDRRLSYGELNRRANKLAHRLRALGVGPETTVGVLLERSEEMLVALLAIWKAGGAFVPMEPTHPPERLAFVARDASLGALLTETPLAERVRDLHQPVLCLDAEREAIERESAQNPSPNVTPQNLAYVIYTSGTTGEPKGVMVEHRSLVNHLCWVDKELLGEAVRVLPAVTSLTFDAALKQLLAPLLRGDAVLVWDADMTGDPEAFMDALRAHKRAGLNCVPSLWQAMLDAVLAGEAVAPDENLARLLLGGEKPERGLVEKTLDVLPGVQVWNLYGPTETTVVASAARLTKGGVVNIGRPLPNMQMFLLDQDMRSTPKGVSGELYIGGAGVARGYLGRADSTAERFIPHPFSREPGARLYRTGDLARYLADGSIEYIGRLDRQVKLRGYRLELDEIETTLRQHRDVREAAVQVCYNDGPQGAQLVAYVVPTRGAALSSDTLRGFIRERLPPYMIPASFITLEALPLTDGGKIDRRALPAPEKGSAETGKVFVGPRNREEEILTRIWSDVLSVEPVGIHDDFFELGGDSILSIRIVARAGQAGIKFTPRQLFEHPTVAGLSAHISRAAVTRGTPTRAIPLTHVQRRLLKESYDGAAHRHHIIALEARQPLERRQLTRVLRWLLMRHDALRLRFTPAHGGGWQQSEVGIGELLPVTELDLSELTGAQQETVLAELAAWPPLHLTEGPLIRAVLCRRAQTPSLLILVVNPLVADATSCRILSEDLQTGYARLSRGEALSLTHQAASFRQWAERVGGEVGSDLTLQGGPPTLEGMPEYAPRLPSDSPEGVAARPSAGTLSLSLSADATGTLLDFAAAARGTDIEAVLLTALLQGVAKWTGRRSWLIDLEDTGRDGELSGLDLSRTVGCFGDFAPTWLSLPETDRLDEALRLVREQLAHVRRRGQGCDASTGGAVADKLRRLPRAEISFAQTSEFGVEPDASSFRPCPWFDELRSGATALGPYLLSVRWQIVRCQLHMSWTYNARLYRPATIERLLEYTNRALHSLITYSRVATPGGAPTDFPEANLGRRELDLFLSRLGKGGVAD
jgi:amino acid adenylation domain-containing protein/non-ribosomal peptide synthase protein (TIGR01720 family)